MSYLFGTGWWTLWYLFLWLGVLPFIWFAIPLARTPVGSHSPGLDLAFALCNVGLVVLLGTLLVSTLLWTAADGGGITRYLIRLGLGLAVAVLGGAGLYTLLLYVTGYASTGFGRWVSCLGMLLGVVAIHLFSLQAAWRFRGTS